MKKIIALLLALVMCFALCSCGEKVTEEDIWAELTSTELWIASASVDGGILGNVNLNDCFTFSDENTVVNASFATGFGGEDMFLSGNMGTVVINLDNKTIDITYSGEVNDDGSVTNMGELKYATLTYSYDGESFNLYTETGIELTKAQ